MENKKCLNNCCDIYITPYKENCNDTYHFNSRNKAGIFIYDPKKNKTLLVQSRGQFWGPPKGSFQENETAIDCALRETLEESGLIFHKYELEKVIQINRGTYYYVEKNVCDVSVQTHLENNDANGITWINLDCLDSLLKNGNMKINQHCRILLQSFLNRYYYNSNFILDDDNNNNKKL